MVNSRYLPVLLASMAQACPCPAQDTEPQTQRIAYDVTYEVTPDDRSDVTLTVLVPQTLPHRQRVVSLDIDPPPLRMREQGGNRYAVFQFHNLRRRVLVKVRTELELWHNDLTTAESREATTDHGVADPRSLLGAETYLEISDPEIDALARRIRGRDPLSIARQSYTMVLHHLAPGPYDGGDHGAAHAAAAKSGDCSEYTDLFVTLCRNKGLPARCVEGFTVPYRDTPAHAWAEVFLEGHGWVAFDPRRGDGGKANFRQLRDRYVYLSGQRNDAVLGSHHYYRYSYDGDPVTVRQRFRERKLK